MTGDWKMGIYQDMEDKWYGFLDWLDEKGVHLYGVVDGIEKAGIPSFPLAALLLLIIVVGSGLFLTGVMQPQHTLTVIVQDALTEDAISGADVEITYTLNDEDKTENKLTSGNGKAEFLVPNEAYVSIKVTKTDYLEGAGTLTVLENQKEKTINLNELATSFDKTIRLKNENGGVFYDEISITFKCTDNYDFSVTRANVSGTIYIDNIPADCGQLYVDSLSDPRFGNVSVYIDLDNPVLELQEEEKPKANVLVHIMDDEGNALDGITVSLKTSSGIEKNRGETGVGGIINFQEVEENTYYIVASDIHGEYALFTSPTRPVLANSENTFTANMRRTIAGTLEVTVLDEDTGKKIKNAPVRLIYNNSEIDTEYTDSEGKVTFELDVNVRHDLEINHPDYLIATLGILQNQTNVTVYLKKATSENSQAINVSVLDSRNRPIENAKVSLMKSDGTIVGNMLTTGFDGLVNFRNLPAGFYHVEAMKTGFESVKSEAIQVLPKKVSDIELILSIGFGTVEVSILDSEKQPIQSGEITMIDLATGEEFDSGISDAQGKKVFDLRLDRKVYFVVEADGYLKYHSIPMYGVENTLVSVSFTLDTDVSSVELEFVGLYANNEIVSNNTLSQGQKYNAMFRLKIPRGTAYREGGIHFRVGNDSEDKTNTLEEDSILIREIFSSAKWRLKGTAYTPSKGYSIDSGKLTTGDSKWVNVVWKNIDAGVYDMIAEVFVKDSASVGETLKLWYRGWGKSGRYVRDPYDETLGDQESSGTRQALYANANLMQYSVGPSNLCGSKFCKSFSIEDVERATKSVVLESYPAKNDSLYNLEFSISSISEKLLANSSIEIRSSGDSLRFDNYNIRGADGISHSSDESAYEITESVGNIGKGSVVAGTVSFKTEKEGANILNIIIKSGKEEVFNRNIVIDVEASKEMHMEILPKELVPFIDNMMLIEISTDVGEEKRKLSAVQISIYYEDELITIGKTDAAGIYPYMLQAPSPGTVKITAEKRGYRKIETEIKLSENILFVTPSEIRERFNASVDDELHVSILIENYTPIPLTIHNLEFSNDFEGKVRFRLDEDYLDMTIAPKKENTLNTNEEDEDSTLVDGQMQLDFIIKLTDAGKLIEKPTKLKGTFTINVTNKDSEKSWFTNIPVEIRIGLGNEVDDSRCIEIEPMEWIVITETQSKSMTFEVKNKCTVDGEPIVLRNFELAIESENENISGVFRAESIDFRAEEMEINEKFEVFAPIMSKNFNGDIEITFTPDNDIASSASDVELVLRATNNTPEGNEKIEVSVPIEISINSLSECVKILGNKEITLTVAPTNLGWNQYQNYGYNPQMGGMPGAYGYGGGYNPSSQYSLPGYGTSGYGNTPLMPAQGYNTPYPQSQYNSDVYTYGQNPSMGWAGMFTGGSSYLPGGAADVTSYNQQMSQSSYSTDGFRIVNECTAPIEINLEIVPAITTDESKFSLESNEEKDVVLNASQRMGIYPLKIKARLDGSKNKFKLVDELRITVTYFEDLLQSGDCIKIVPPSKISLTDPFGRPAKLEIYNYCYDMGIRLATGSGGIEISCNVPNLGGNLLNPAYSGAIGGIPSGGDSSCPIIEQPSWFMGERMGSGSQGREQVVSFEIKPNLAFRQDVASTLNQNPNASLGFLRATAQAMVYYINVRGNLHVNFRQQFGNSQTDYPIIIEDLWRLEEFGLTTDPTQIGDGEPLQQGDGGEGTMSSCDSEKTGESVYNKYGFDKLLFTWKWEDVKKNICDEIEISDTETKMFCDATQFSISLAQKGKVIKEFIDMDKMNEDSLFEGVSGFETIADFRDTEHLYLWVKDIIHVTDDATGESYLFFLKNDNEILENEKLNIDEFKDAKSIQGYTDILDVVPAMKRLMTAVENSNNADEKDIIGIIDVTNFTTEEKTILTDKLKAGKPVNFNKHIITFNEYKKLHNALAADSGCLGSDSCDVTIFENQGTVTVKASLLQTIYNSIEFKVGMRAKSNLIITEHEEIITTIMRDAQDREGIDDSFKFWKENLRFDSYLIKDNYGDAGQYSKTKFKNRYLSYDNGELDNIGFESWNLVNESSINDKAGKHYLFLNYNWEENDNAFTLKAVKDYATLGDVQSEGNEYTNNIFFFKALNAGLDDGKAGMTISQTGGIQGGTAQLAESMSNFSESFNDVRDGWVLTVNGNTFNYEPSSPVNILAKISGETSGMFYEMNPEAGDIYLLQWKNGTLLKDRKESGSNIVRVCSNISTDEYGLSGNISGNRRAIAYVPINVPTKLRMLCSNSQHSLSSREFTPQGNQITGRTDTATVSRNITGENAVLELNNTEMVNHYSIEEYLELINTGEICVSEASSDVFKIYWNSDKFYNIAN